MSVLTDLLTKENAKLLIVHETEQFVAIMEPTPNALGHVICFPKQEVHDLFAFEQETYQQFLAFVQAVAVALKKVVPCRKIGMASIGLAVEHVHIHLVPINHPIDMNFMATHESIDDKTKQRLAVDIRSHIKS